MKGYHIYANRKLNIGDIPTDITHLEFGAQYNQVIDLGVLPDSLLFISFGNFLIKK